MDIRKHRHTSGQFVFTYYHCSTFSFSFSGMLLPNSEREGDISNVREVRRTKGREREDIKWKREEKSGRLKEREHGNKEMIEEEKRQWGSRERNEENKE